MKYFPVQAIAPSIGQNSAPMNFVALGQAGRASRSAQPLGKTLARVPQTWPRKLASFTLTSLLYTTMFTWFGFLSWGVFSAARWLWQLIW
jgi:hypothetical protein